MTNAAGTTGKEGKIAVAVLFWLFIGGMVIADKFVWGEREGSIKTDDCRTAIWIDSKSPRTWFTKFTCEGAVCSAVETDGLACKTSYSYLRAVKK